MSAARQFIENARATVERTRLEDLPLADLLAKASPLPWGACHSGCTCGSVWSKGADHPVATAQRGDWGDDYPALRFVRDGEPCSGTSLGATVEAYMAQITYGTLPIDAEKYNSALIAAAVNAVPRFLAIEQALRELAPDHHSLTASPTPQPSAEAPAPAISSVSPAGAGNPFRPPE